MPSLFGHLVHNFSKHPENLATEALAFILGSSAVARKALANLLAPTGVALPADLTFVTQVAGSDQAIPDLVGRTPANEPVLIGEAKFWAGLTGNQPVTYLRRLADRADGLLLFIAPARRFTTLWAELVRRCNAAHLTAGEKQQVNDEFLYCQVKRGPVLALVSWRLLLASMGQALDAAGEHHVAADIHQLQGLCERMDSEAFIPLGPEEMTSAIGTRMIQFSDIVNNLTDLLVHEGKASIKGLKATATANGFGRYMRIGPYGCMLQLNYGLWSNLRETPLWLTIMDAQGTGHWRYSPEARQRLSRWELDDPPRLMRSGNQLLIPLFLRPNAEREQVIAELHEEIDRIIAALEVEGPGEG